MTDTGHEARTRAVLAHLNKRATTNLHLPREVADILAEMAQQIANQNIKLVQQAEEMAALRSRVETITSALLEHLPRERVA